jgi:hypothetical protein
VKQAEERYHMIFQHAGRARGRRCPAVL